MSDNTAAILCRLVTEYNLQIITSAYTGTEVKFEIKGSIEQARKDLENLFPVSDFDEIDRPGKYIILNVKADDIDGEPHLFGELVKCGPFAG